MAPWLRARLADAPLFDRVLWAAVLGILTLGGIGVVWAALGRLVPGVVLAIAATGAVVGFAFPPATRPVAARGWPTVAAVVVVVGITTFNAAHAGEHLLQDRDPGVYATTAVWVSEHGRLQLPGLEGPFRMVDGAHAAGAGFFEEDDGTVVPQFLHFLSIVQAGAAWIGGLGLLFATNAVLGGLAMLALFGLASQLVDRWLATAAAAAAGVTLPQLWFSRDSFSEIPAQLFVLAGLWCVVIAVRGQRGWPAVAGGALLGGAAMARLDFLVLATVVIAWGAVEVALGSDASRGERIRRCGLVLGGFVVTAAVAILDGAVASRPYLSLLRHDVALMAAGAAAAAAAGVLLVATRTQWSGLAISLGRHRSAIAVSVGVVVVAAGFAAWLIRPVISQPRAATPNPHVAVIQAAEDASPDPQRTYSEASLPRLAGYIGPVALAAGLVGTGLLVTRALRGDRRLWLPLAGLGAISVLYLVSMRIVPDQIWAIRRFVPTTLPLLALGVAAVAGVAWRSPRTSVRVLGVALIAVAIAYPVATVAPVATVRPHDGTVAAMREVCHAAGTDGAVLLLDDGDLNVVLPQVVRALCDVPVASAPAPDDPEGLVQLAAAWREEGRSLLVLVGSPPSPLADNLRTVPLTTLMTEELQPTLARRPSTVQQRRWEVRELILPSEGPTP